MHALLRRSFFGLMSTLAVFSLLITINAPSASAFPAGDPVYRFVMNVDASTHVQKADQTVNITGGTFTGGVDLANGWLIGAMKLPATTFTYNLAGIVPAVTATAKIVPTKPVVGRLDLSNLVITATATFNIRITDAHAPGVPVNLVGNWCVTSIPVSVTMSGSFTIGAPSVFTGTYTLPTFKTCGPSTEVLNQLLPGPGNTFTASATDATS